MLEQIDNLPPDVWGLRATGRVSAEDYQRVVIPVLERARVEGRRIRLLYQLGPAFDGFAPGAALEDFQVGLRYLRLFDRCAVVTDTEWVRTTTRGVAALMPCPVKTFANDAFQEAVDWLASTREPSLTYQMLPSRGVLVVEPHGPLRTEDFDALEAAADSWIESGDGSLRGIVVHARRFPGWENLGTLLRHLRFVRDHHRKIRRVAVAVDGALAQIAPALADHFVHAELKQFSADDLEPAIAWAGNPPPGPAGGS
jgi:hypothetical protein